MSEPSPISEADRNLSLVERAVVVAETLAEAQDAYDGVDLLIYHGETHDWPKPMRAAFALAWWEARRWRNAMKQEWRDAQAEMKTPEFRKAWRDAKREEATI